MLGVSQCAMLLAPSEHAFDQFSAGLRRESTALKEVVAEQALEIRLLKKSMIADGGDDE